MYKPAEPRKRSDYREGMGVWWLDIAPTSDTSAEGINVLKTKHGLLMVKIRPGFIHKMFEKQCQIMSVGRACGSIVDRQSIVGLLERFGILNEHETIAKSSVLESHPLSRIIYPLIRTTAIFEGRRVARAGDRSSPFTADSVGQHSCLHSVGYNQSLIPNCMVVQDDIQMLKVLPEVASQLRVELELEYADRIDVIAAPIHYPSDEQLRLIQRLQTRIKDIFRPAPATNVMQTTASTYRSSLKRSLAAGSSCCKVAL